MENPFQSFNVEIPKQYAEQIKSFTHTAKDSWEFAPFDRQVDFWYFCFCYAIKKNLKPQKESNMSNITFASILSNDSYRIQHIQLAYIGYHKSIESIADHRKVFTFAIEMANAAMPHIFALLKDADERPIWNIFNFLEETLKK